MRRPRFTVRRLMVAVAIVAALVWSVTIAMRWVEYRRIAAHHEEVCDVLSGEIESLTVQAEGEKSQGRLMKQRELEDFVRHREIALSEESRLAMKYRRAMNQPWRSVTDARR